jgi:predicted O-methyltransferase YrrM
MIEEIPHRRPSQKQVINYIPQNRENPKLASCSSAWGNIPTILNDLINRFNLKQDKALEFGVEYGYSTSALANYFKSVTGVDTFEGDVHSGTKSNHIEITSDNLKEFKNVQLIKSDYREYIKMNNEFFDLIHIDIIHNYYETFECGEWSVNHSNCIIFHDTLSFPEVFRAVYDLSVKYDLDFYNYTESHGLGILIRK